ncbi:hypothetical protein LTR16_006581 [Cryomyces antarcticus]|uniref:Uncharacterized protein n=1 Tax=Cryomyces antarcticus TaxID=329879 RepID=A0ABR0KQ87_9PEZI|nr:hypothetical protein LTR16_006581 [Cryomyces antarcticus]
MAVSSSRPSQHLSRRETVAKPVSVPVKSVYPQTPKRQPARSAPSAGKSCLLFPSSSFISTDSLIASPPRFTSRALARIAERRQQERPVEERKPISVPAPAAPRCPIRYIERSHTVVNRTLFGIKRQRSTLEQFPDVVKVATRPAKAKRTVSWADDAQGLPLCSVVLITPVGKEKKLRSKK